jgi:hypothetical protein
MSKIKLCLMIAAVICGVFGAIASKSRALCETQPQYYKFGNSYLPAGDYGVDYICLSAGGNCTYYLSNPFNPNSFAPCRVGAFSWAYSNKH